MFETQVDESVQQFATDVISGLTSNPKTLSSKYFYDEIGDKIFQEIMGMEEYYLTRAEYEVFETQKEKILKLISPEGQIFNLVEFGAGDGYKTKVLLEHFLQNKADFEYLPIDISENALSGLKGQLNKIFPELKAEYLQGDYFEVLDEISHSSVNRNVVLFLGSNIGNFKKQEAINFLNELRKDLNPGDLLLMGIDLKKDPDKILAAYDDPSGITARFNLNLLERINRELGGNFETSEFRHHSHYDPISGECRSALMSLTKQTVDIADEKIEFDTWEPIHMEISKKYSLREIEALAAKTGFIVKENLTDQEKLFVDSIWEAV